MRDSFRASCILTDQPGGEAKWVARFTAGSVLQESKPFDTKPEGFAWLAARTRAFLAEPVVIPAPDGDGVVVGGALEQRVVFQAPAVAVHVGRLSPLASNSLVAAQIAERLHYAAALLEEAASLAATVGGDAVGPGNFEGMLWGAEDRVEQLLEWSGCVVLSQVPAPRWVRCPAAHLVVVPDGGPDVFDGHCGGA